MMDQEALERELTLSRQDRTALLRVLLRVETKITKLDSFARSVAFGGPPGRTAVVASAVAVTLSTLAFLMCLVILWRVYAPTKESQDLSVGDGRVGSVQCAGVRSEDPR